MDSEITIDGRPRSRLRRKLLVGLGAAAAGGSGAALVFGRGNEAGPSRPRSSSLGPTTTTTASPT